eukprot:2333933-Amphidinium_carterae.2
MDRSTVQSMLITLGVIPLTAVIAVGVSPKVMSEISQISKSVIRKVIRISSMRNRSKVRNESQGNKQTQTESLRWTKNMRIRCSSERCRTQRANIMVAKQVGVKELSRAQIKAVRLNVKDDPPQKFKGARSQLKPWADEVIMTCCFCQLRIQDSLSHSGACRLHVSPSPTEMLSVDTQWKQIQTVVFNDRRRHSRIPLADMKCGVS